MLSLYSITYYLTTTRLKGAGMHWQRGYVNALQALRNGVCNERWQESWQLPLSQHFHQQVLRRKL